MIATQVYLHIHLPFTNHRLLQVRKFDYSFRYTIVRIFCLMAPLSCYLFQSHWRGYYAVNQYLWLKVAAIATQCAWRSRMARKELQTLKMVRELLLAFLSDCQFKEKVET